MLSDTQKGGAHPTRRDMLLDTAFRLFNKYGYHAVGIDTIVAESGVAKTTLYRYFPSKEDLIVAVLERLHDQSDKAVEEYLESIKDKPREKVLAFFDFLEMAYKEPDFYGCQFMRAAGEFTDSSHKIFKTATSHIVWAENLFKKFLSEAGIKENSYIAQELNILLQGSISVAFLKSEPSQANFAKVAAKRILDSI